MRKGILFTAPIFLSLAMASTASGQAPAPATNVAPPEATATSAPEPHTSPVFWISSIEILRSAHAPQLDIIRVRGLVPTAGWESAQLVPLTKGAPVDGMLDLAMIADAPEDSTEAAAYAPIEAIFVLESGHPFAGVRVHGAANRLTLKTLPGYTQAAATPTDCAACKGKYLLRKGETEAAGRSVVREEDLPHNARIVRASDGLGAFDTDPNRMTLLLSDEGQIVAVLWD